jgi:2-amino-4-hydroxy-6-hydroxymethyldihydropteridine diphosphokinase
MNTAVISAGSNINPDENLSRAEEMLRGEMRVAACARRLVTKPVGFARQPDFVNTAFLVETPLDKTRLTALLKGIEASLGRVRGPERYGPRTIDLDIAVFNGEVADNDVYARDFLRTLIIEVEPGMKERLAR